MINTYLYAWGLFSGVCAVACEVIFRKYGSGGYLNLVPYVIIPAIGVNYGVFKTMSYSHHFLETFIIFSFSTATLRLISTAFILHEPLVSKMVIAYVLLLSAQFVRGL